MRQKINDAHTESSRKVSGKHIRAITVSCLAAFVLAACLATPFSRILFPPEQFTCSVTALDKRNENAEGSEIVIKSVIVDGVTYRPRDIFKTGWLDKDSWIQWRNYDLPDDLTDQLKGAVPKGNSIMFVFEKNKWRGIASIEVNGDQKTLDFYGDTEDSLDESVEFLFSDVANEKESFSFTTLITAAILFLIMFALFFSLILLLWKDDREDRATPVNLGSAPFKRRELWIDLLKIISIAAIAVIHRSANGYGDFSESVHWYQQLFIDSATRFAVPCFMFISGYLLINKEETLKAACKRVVNSTIVLLVWSIIIALFMVHIQKSADSIFELLKQIPVKHLQSHLWYVYELIWFQLLVPVFREVSKKCDMKLNLVFIMGGMAIPAVFDFIFRSCLLDSGNVVQVGWQVMGIPEMATFYAGWVFVSFVKRKIAHGEALWRICRHCLLLSVTGFTLMFLLSYWATRTLNRAYPEWFFQNRLPALLFGTGIFLLFYVMENRLQSLPSWTKGIIHKAGSLVMGVFYTHAMFIWTYEGIGITGFYGALLSCLTAFVASYALSYVPYVKKLVG